MATILQLRRGTSTQHSTFTGAPGEVTVDTTKKTIVVHDGSTAGGSPLATEDFVTTTLQTADSLGELSGTSDDITEGSTNLFFTDSRARATISVTGSGTYDDATGVIDITGDVSSVNSLTGAVVLDTDDISEGSSNLYFTNARARGAVSVTDNGGDGSLSYNSTTGVISYTGPSASEVRAHFSAGTGITITNGAVAVDSTIATKTYADSAATTAVAAVIDAAPATLDTLNELAAALGDDANFATTVTDSIATKLNSSAVSAFGLTLVDDADAAAARATLGLGTAATTASSAYATAAQGTKADNALPAANVSAFGGTLIDDADAAAARATLGLGTAATTAATAYATAAQGATADAALPAASYTAADVLAKIKTVDGSGSGLDADLLDGQSSAYFRINIYDAAGTLLN